MPKTKDENVIAQTEENEELVDSYVNAHMQHAPNIESVRAEIKKALFTADGDSYCKQFFAQEIFGITISDTQTEDLYANALEVQSLVMAGKSENVLPRTAENERMVNEYLNRKFPKLDDVHEKIKEDLYSPEGDPKNRAVFIKEIFGTAQVVNRAEEAVSELSDEPTFTAEGALERTHANEARVNKYLMKKFAGAHESFVAAKNILFDPKENATARAQLVKEIFKDPDASPERKDLSANPSAVVPQINLDGTLQRTPQIETKVNEYIRNKFGMIHEAFVAVRNVLFNVEGNPKERAQLIKAIFGTQIDMNLPKGKEETALDQLSTPANTRLKNQATNLSDEEEFHNKVKAKGALPLTPKEKAVLAASEAPTPAPGKKSPPPTLPKQKR